MKRGERTDLARPPRSWVRASDAERRRAVVRALDEEDGCVARAARSLGLARTYLHELLGSLPRQGSDTIVGFDSLAGDTLLDWARDLRRERWHRPSGRGRPPG